ncbi:hypothetical protein GSI_07598 [Ganoderma sinense ZZ0214-1]|uniref:Uncharacterized protein n=1 Tax=Ganoderma sinense ZZ0214-1 TaxID=1077348 RepID=A0A2G8S9I8_9APHY|nr:hypothetical protein GSI_07598 [Ganoderma sinense ZZ0214-1]
MNGDGPSQSSDISDSIQNALGGPQACPSIGNAIQNPPIGPTSPQQSPSLAQHHVSGGTRTAGTAMTPEMLASELTDRITPLSLARLKQDLGMPDKDVASMKPEDKRRTLNATRVADTEMTSEMLNAELDGILPPTLAKLKRRLGMAGKDIAAMTSEEKRRVVRLPDSRAENPSTADSQRICQYQWNGHDTAISTASASPPPRPQLETSVFSMNSSESMLLDPSVSLDDARVDFQRDFAAWFNPEEADRR